MIKKSNKMRLVKPESDVPSYVQQSTRPDPVIWGITNACGGAGATSLAVQMAFRLATQKHKTLPFTPRIALLELDFENSVLQQYLDVIPRVRVDYFADDPSRVDADLTEAWMIPTPFGFSVFSAPAVLDGNNLVNPQTVLAFLDNVSGLYDYIIIDVPRIWMPWTHAALGAADKLAVVTELSVPSLHQAYARAAALMEAIEPLDKIDFIVNKYERRSFRSSLKIKDAEKALGPVETVTLCAEHVREAMNRGEPVGATHPESRFTKDVNGIVGDWLKETQAQQLALKATG